MVLVNILILLSALLILLAIRKIWKSLALNAGLRRNERIMHIHLFLVTAFTFSAMVLIIGEFIKYTATNLSSARAKPFISISSAIT